VLAAAYTDGATRVTFEGRTVTYPLRAAPAACGAYAWAAAPLIDTDPGRRRRDRRACPPNTPGKTRQDRRPGARVHAAGKSLAARRLTCETE
jgi:hypothetical protein